MLQNKYFILQKKISKQKLNVEFDVVMDWKEGL